MSSVSSPLPADAGRSASVLGASVLGLLLLALLPAGSVWPGALAILHLGLLGVAILALQLPDAHLARAGRALGWARATLLILVALLPGLLPWPSAVLRVAAPGRLEASPGVAWAFGSLDPERTVGALCTAVLVVGFGLLVAVWGTRRQRRSRADRAAVGLLLGLVLFGGLHALSGAEKIGWLIPVQTPPVRLFAPLVNPNHFGTLLVLGLPVAVGVALEPRHRGTPWGALAATTTVLAGVAVIAVASPGVWLSLLVVAAIAFLIGPGSLARRLGTVAGLAAAAALGMVLFASLWDRSWGAYALPMRLAQWMDQPTVLGWFPVLGSGGGTYELAYAPFRTSPGFKRFEHAHSDWVEWAVETGAIGVILALVAFAWLLRGLESDEGRSRKWDLALIGVAVHAAVEFPLQIPALAMAVSGAAAIRYAVYARTRPALPGVVRRWLVVLAVLQVPAAAWQARSALADRAASDLRMLHEDAGRAAQGARLLALTAPWRADLRLYDAWTAELVGSGSRAADAAATVVASHPDDAGALRQAGLVLARNGRAEEARSALERAAERDPNDYRTWAALARLLAEDPTTGAEPAEAWAEALRHWPYDRAARGAPMREGLALMPVGIWWVDALSDAPIHWSLYLGAALVERGEPETALIAYEQAAERDPAYRDWPPRARALAALGRPDEAEDLVRERLKREPESIMARYVLAELLRARGGDEQATTLYLEILARDPTDARAQVEAVRAAEGAKGLEGGRAMGERLALAGRHSAELTLERARLDLESGRAGECVERLDGIGALGPALEERARRLRARCARACVTCAGVPAPTTPPHP